MKVVHVSTWDGAGGAGVAAYRLHAALLDAGADSRMFVENKCREDERVLAFRPARGLCVRLRRVARRLWISAALRRYVRTRPPGLEPFSDPRTIYGAAPVRQLPPCDILHLHWVAQFVDYGEFFRRLPSRVRVVWTLHDMNAFTGGCHYDLGCGRFAAQCGACPQLGSRSENDLSRAGWRRKRDAFRRLRGRMHIVTPSHWMAEQVRLSSLLGEFAVTVIPNGVDAEQFAPRDPVACRSILGLPSEARVLLFLAHSVDNRRKGFGFLRDALAGLRGVKDLVLLSAGAGRPDVPAVLPHVHLGYVQGQRFLSAVYSAADLFVIPSLQDNLPNTVLESMACGRPVVGFEVGGIPDMVRPGETGFLVPPQDADALRETILGALSDMDRLRAMSERCRQTVLNDYTLARQAQRCLELYRLLVD